MLKGDLGQPPSGWPAALRRGAEGRCALYGASGSRLEDADLDAGPQDDRDQQAGTRGQRLRVASYLMYPKVFTDFALASDTYGPVSAGSCLRLLFLRSWRRRAVCRHRRSKTLVIVNQAMSGTDSQGMVTVFFELNGQPRRIKVPDRAHGATGAAARRKACRQAMPPMSARRCLVSSPAPSSPASPDGQRRRRAGVYRSHEDGNGDPCGEGWHDRQEFLVKAGDQIDAKDMLVVWK